MAQSDNKTQSSRPSRDPHTDMAVGEILRRTREHYNQSLDAVESVLRIRAEQLKALEDGRIDLLPGRAYAIGFVRAYAEYLGLDGEKMVQLFKSQSGASPRPKKELHFPAPASESKLPNYLILAASAAGLCFVVAGIVYMTSSMAPETHDVPHVPATLRAETIAQQGEPQLAKATPPVVGPVLPGQSQGIIPGTPVTPETIPPAPALVQNTPPVADPQVDIAVAAAETAVAATEAPPQPAPQQPVDELAQAPVTPIAPAPVPQADELVIRVVETAWVEVRGTDGRAILSRVLKPGDSYTVPQTTGLTMDTGNVGGLEFILNGQVLPPLGARGDVRRRIILDPAILAPQSSRRSSNDAAYNAAAINPAAGGE